MQAVRDERIVHNLQEKLINETNWISLLKILKDNEKNTKFFKLLTAYDDFKWHTTNSE